MFFKIVLFPEMLKIIMEDEVSEINFQLSQISNRKSADMLTDYSLKGRQWFNELTFILQR